jgi:hypothetical protein
VSPHVKGAQIHISEAPNTRKRRNTNMLIATRPDEILQEGLEIGGFNRQQQQRVKRNTNLRQFRAMYGSNPIVYAQIIEDLQTTHSN